MSSSNSVQSRPSKRSLSQAFPGALDVPLALFLSAALLIYGLFTPVITIKQMIFKTDTFSVLTGIESLWHEHQKVLAVIVFVFSILFPIGKLWCLAWIWFGRFTDEARVHALRWFNHLGKWSMLDVFIVAMTIVIAKIAALVDARARVGVYIFAASIALSIIAGMRVERLASMKPADSKTKTPRG